MKRLEGKVALVTGASTGMGRAIAVALAAEGANVAIVARSAANLDETARLAREHGVEVLPLAGDVGDSQRVKEVVRQVVERFGTVDILVNNAGTNTRHRNLNDTSMADWNHVLATNLTGAFLFTQETLPTMRAAGRGLVISISSGAGLHPGAPAGVAYSASKHGIHSLTGSINLEERRHGIRASVVVPGETDTPNLDLRPLPPPAEQRRGMLQPEDIASAVVFVATQPDHVAVEMVIVSPTQMRDYNADYERYVAEGHTERPKE